MLVGVKMHTSAKVEGKKKGEKQEEEEEKKYAPIVGIVVTISPSLSL